MTYETVEISLDNRTIEALNKIAKLSGADFNTVINVLLATYVVKDNKNG